MRTREQIGVKKFRSWKHSFFPGLCAEWMFIQNNILTSKCFIYLFTSFVTVNQHSEGIKQDRIPIDINPLVTHPIQQRFAAPAELLPLLFSNSS